MATENTVSKNEREEKLKQLLQKHTGELPRGTQSALAKEWGVSAGDVSQMVTRLKEELGYVKNAASAGEKNVEKPQELKAEESGTQGATAPENENEPKAFDSKLDAADEAIRKSPVWEKYLRDPLVAFADSKKDVGAPTILLWRDQLASSAKGKTSYKSDPGTSNVSLGAFFGLVQGQSDQGQYPDLSYIVFPIEKSNSLYAVTLNVGSSDWVNDYALAARPGTRRSWKNFLKTYEALCTEREGVRWRVKESFTDKQIEIDHTSNLPNGLYQKTTLAYAVVDVSRPTGYLMMLGMFAFYANMRGWIPNGAWGKITDLMRKVVKTLQGKGTQQGEDEFAKVSELVHRRRFVVLQGAPGTGKTRLAKEIAKQTAKEEQIDEGKNVVFTQFHAETSYSDFVYGLRPKLDVDTKNGDNVAFKGVPGELLKAIEKAMEFAKENKKVYLIIDEINRANLASVLGPSFYLFEQGLDGTGPEIELSPECKLRALPPNLYVIATMNTADRSLAVVDFALRRRFAWYTMEPRELTFEDTHPKYFGSAYYRAISERFDMYASDEELNLKPGHAYFIVDRSEDEATNQLAVKERLRYEVMPLIKEYLTEGLMVESRNDFYQYFKEVLNEEMFQ